MISADKIRSYAPFSAPAVDLPEIQSRDLLFGLDGHPNKIVRAIERVPNAEDLLAFSEWKTHLEWVTATYGIHIPKFSIVALDVLRFDLKHWKPRISRLYYFPTNKVQGQTVRNIWGNPDFPHNEYDQFTASILQYLWDSEQRGGPVLRDHVDGGGNVMLGTQEADTKNHFYHVDISPHSAFNLKEPGVGTYTVNIHHFLQGSLPGPLTLAKRNEYLAYLKENKADPYHIKVIEHY